MDWWDPAAVLLGALIGGLAAIGGQYIAIARQAKYERLQRRLAAEIEILYGLQGALVAYRESLTTFLVHRRQGKTGTQPEYAALIAARDELTVLSSHGSDSVVSIIAFLLRVTFKAIKAPDDPDYHLDQGQMMEMGTAVTGATQDVVYALGATIRKLRQGEWAEVRVDDIEALNVPH